MRIAPLLVPVLAGLTLAGCTRAPRTEFVRLRRMTSPARRADAVDVFLTSPPERPYAEVGIVEAHEQDDEASTAQLVAALRARAGRAGCDGVVVLGEADEPVRRSATVDGLRGVCVVYRTGRDDPASP
jgi:hypothetical protein